VEATTQWFVEQMGLNAESDGLPRIAGRLFGFLLLSPGPRSLDEIAAELGVSKGSVSTDARLLLRHGWLRRVSQPGDRRDYYEMAPDFFGGIVAYRLTRWEALHDLVSEARQRLPQQTAPTEERLQYLDQVQEFFLTGIRDLLTEWRVRQAKASGGASRTPAVAQPARRTAKATSSRRRQAESRTTPASRDV
jgi:DNA-binding transcriptional regulator GbsR (MarR family)